MKLYPCSHCGKYALHPATPRFPRGMPAVFGRVTSNPTVNKCFRCGRASRFSITELNRLPHLTLEQLERLEMRELALADLIGLGLSEREAEDLFKASENSPASRRQGVWAEAIEELHNLTRSADGWYDADHEEALRENARSTEAA